MSGQELTGRKISEIRDYLSDLAPIGEYMRDKFSSRVVANFRRGGPLNQPWAPLAPATLKAREEKVGYYAQPGRGGILLWTSSLQESFKIGGKKAYLRVTNRSRGLFQVQFGSNHPLAHIHHFGTSFTRPAIFPTDGKKALRMIMSDGIQFSKRAGPADITIPARPLWSERQIEMTEQEGVKAARKKIRSIING